MDWGTPLVVRQKKGRRAEAEGSNVGPTVEGRLRERRWNKVIHDIGCGF